MSKKAVRLGAVAAVVVVGVAAWQVDSALSTTASGNLLSATGNVGGAPIVASGGQGSTQAGSAERLTRSRSGSGRRPATRSAKGAVSRSGGSNAAGARAAVRAHRSAAASPSASPSHSRARSAPLTCSGTSGMLPANYGIIVKFLASHGYSRMAAAGIAGNIYQESKGDPESIGTGGGGLIGWTPLPAGYVTGNPSADLQTQLAAILVYNQQWSQYLPALNTASTPAGAADIYMNYFERPGLPAAANREAAAAAVAQACGIK